LCNKFLPLCTTVALCRHIDANKAKYIETLREVVAIKSVSAWPDHRHEIDRQMEWAAKRLKQIGATVEMCDVGNQTLPDGKTLKLPNVILGSLGNVSQTQLRNLNNLLLDLWLLAALSYRNF